MLEQQTRDDIRCYVNSKFDTVRKIYGEHDGNALRTIESEIIEKANGVFLWVLWCPLGTTRSEIENQKIMKNYTTTRGSDSLN